MVGEAFRGILDKVKIATKFGWGIDQDTGEHRGGVNSKPGQIRRAAEGCGDSASIPSISCTSTESTPTC